MKDLEKGTIGIIVRKEDVALQQPPQIGYEGEEGFVSALLAERFEILGEFPKPQLNDASCCGAGIKNCCCGALGIENGSAVCHIDAYILVGANSSWQNYINKSGKRAVRPFNFHCLRSKKEDE